MPRIYRRNHITREFVKTRRSIIFVFGDNLQQRGYGGQAAAMRGEPNAVGIPTKHFPNNKPASFFADVDFPRVKPFIDAAFNRLKSKLELGHDVVIPSAGVGTGLAKLPTLAPKIHDYIEEQIRQLEDLARKLE